MSFHNRLINSVFKYAVQQCVGKLYLIGLIKITDCAVTTCEQSSLVVIVYRINNFEQIQTYCEYTKNHIDDNSVNMCSAKINYLSKDN